jgi:hypothetical protein
LADMTYFEMAWTGPNDASPATVDAVMARMASEYMAMNGLDAGDYDATRIEPVEIDPGVSVYVEQWQAKG